MRNKIVRKLLLIALLLVSFAIFYVVYRAISGAEDPMSRFLYFLPFVLQILVNIILITFLDSNYTRYSGLEYQIAPLLLFSITLENIKVLNLYSVMNYQVLIKESIVNKVYFFAILLSAFTFVGLSLYQQAKSSQKSNNYILLSLLFTFFLSFFGPTIDYIGFSETYNFYTVIVGALYAIAILNLFINIFRNFEKTKLIENIFLIFCAIGNFMITIVSKNSYNYPGLFLYDLGIIGLIVLVSKKNNGNTYG